MKKGTEVEIERQEIGMKKNKGDRREKIKDIAERKGGNGKVCKNAVTKEKVR